jgi:hypothetical protein
LNFSSTCNVNTDEMMNPATGHVTVRTSGDYFISFTANMVSVKSQAIWCQCHYTFFFVVADKLECLYF